VFVYVCGCVREREIERLLLCRNVTGAAEQLTGPSELPYAALTKSLRVTTSSPLYPFLDWSRHQMKQSKARPASYNLDTSF
jgi:hypothetical protein